MARVTYGRQGEIRQSDVYDDTLTPGDLETPADDVEYDLNALRSLRKHDTGLDEWDDDLGAIRTQKALHEAVAALEAGGGGGGGRAYQYSTDRKVPGGGTLYLSFGRSITSSAAPAIERAGSVSGAAIVVDTADPTKAYALEVLVNGAVAETLVLPATQTHAYADSFSAAVSAGDEVAARVVRTNGGGVSAFSDVAAIVALAAA